jgi:hypothetical protein
MTGAIDDAAPAVEIALRIRIAPQDAYKPEKSLRLFQPLLPSGSLRRETVKNLPFYYGEPFLLSVKFFCKTMLPHRGR